MTEQRAGFYPRARKGEIIPTPPAGKEVTRLHGELVFVSERKPGEPYAGKSPYTPRQLGELEEMFRERQARREAPFESRGAW